MEVKVLEVRDSGTFLPLICVRPFPDNDEQRYLLCRDGFSCDPNDNLVIVIDAHRYRASYNPHEWPGNSRTQPVAHRYITEHWNELKDGDVVDIEFILGISAAPKISERLTVPL